MIFDFNELPAPQRYQYMTQTLIPRPVAWTLTENPSGDYNLAPFSFFTALGSEPPLVLLSTGRKPDGEFKDTRVNIEARKFFVIHIAHRGMAAAMTESSRTLPLGESELTRAGLEVTPIPGFPLPRLADCRVAMACELYEIQEIGPVPQTLIFGLVKQLYVADEAVARDEKGRTRFDARVIDPIGRLGASEYTTFGELITIPRPK